MSSSKEPWNYEHSIEGFRDKIAFANVGNFGSVRNPPYPEIVNLISSATQVKLQDVLTLLACVGLMPPEKFPLILPLKDYKILKPNDFAPLIACGFQPFGEHGRLFVGNYIKFFHRDKYVPTRNVEKFYGHLIHVLLIEVEVLTIIHYFTGLGLTKQVIPLSVFSELSGDTSEDLILSQLGIISYPELYGRPFVDLLAILTRAQWDKLTHLLDIAFDLKSWDSIDVGLKALESCAQKLSGESSRLLMAYHQLATDRLKNSKSGGWLRPFRDGLLHSTGKHSLGVVPQKKSLETTTELWNKGLQEHDYWREALYIALLAIRSSGEANPKLHTS